MRLRRIDFIIEVDEDREATVEAHFTEYGWSQWGATKEVLSRTTPILEAIADATLDDPALRSFVGLDVDDEDGEEW